MSAVGQSSTAYRAALVSSWWHLTAWLEWIDAVHSRLVEVRIDACLIVDDSYRLQHWINPRPRSCPVVFFRQTEGQTPHDGIGRACTWHSAAKTMSRLGVINKIHWCCHFLPSAWYTDAAAECDNLTRRSSSHRSQCQIWVENRDFCPS